MRTSLLLLLLAALPFPARAADVVEVRTLLWQHGAERDKLVCAWDPVSGQMRVEMPDRRFGVIWREKDDFFTGLEERDAMYWEFSWPQISAAVGKHTGAASDFKEPIVDASAGALGKAPAPVTETAPSAILWKMKAMGDKDAVWTGLVNATVDVEARVVPQPPAGLEMFWKRYARVADLMRLVAVREMGPGDLTPLVASFVNMPEANRSPLALTWINGTTPTNVVTVADSKTVPRDPVRFAAPSGYQKTTLSTLEGLLEEAPAPKPKDDDSQGKAPSIPSLFKGM